MGKLSLLTVTTLFPNPAQPAHGMFVATRLKYLLASNVATAEVVAPVAWVPPGISYPGFENIQRVPAQRAEDNLRIYHPRYLVVPKVGMTLTPYALYRTLKQSIVRLLEAGKRFDMIDAHYFYPDGVAAVRIAQEFNIPICVTARGTDLNFIPRYPKPRAMIIDAAMKADGLITVCQALKDSLLDMLPVPKDVRVLRNGVDLERFRLCDRIAARKLLDCHRRTLVSVGLLIERKGHHLVIEALQSLPDTDLLIVGEGPERGALQQLAKSLGVANRVRFLGLIEHAQLGQIYNAADALVLASSREGWANVLLEAMACGTPVVATAVWGTPEVVAQAEAGVLMTERSATGVAEGVKRLFAKLPDRESTRRYAEKFSWQATTTGQLELFHQILERRQPKRAA
jgi:glycosyltransferase involved in cell wall biosynthesis